jgi:PTS system mannose-specific IIC component
MITPDTGALLLAWGMVVGLDLVSLPQMMVARPLVAATGAGLVLGDVPTGLLVGLLLELYQYDVLPVGAARYPEYGPAAVAAVTAAHDVPGPAGLALGALVGLLVAVVGGASLGFVRRLNTAAVRTAGARLDTGDPRVLWQVHGAALARDAARALAVTALGLGAAWAARTALAGTLVTGGGAVVAAAAAGAALAAGASGTLRLVGRGLDLRWLAAGVTLGTVLAWIR